MSYDYASRIEKLRLLMGTDGIDAVLLSIGSDLPYFSGYTAMPSERLTMMVVALDRPTTLLVPELEAPRVPEGPFETVAWSESQDPISLVTRMLSETSKIAIGDHTWAASVVALQNQLGRREWSLASALTSELRMRKEPGEIAALREVARQADQVALRIPQGIVFVGSSEREVSRKVREMLLEEGHDEAEFAIVASGPNGASPHHEPGSRVIGEGDTVVIDFGGSLGGYKSDTTRTFVVGEPANEIAEAYRVVLSANQAARSAVSPGVPCEEVDRVARGVIASAGFGEFFIHRTGHGIGLDVHEHPYMIEGNSTPLEEGMAFSVEPGVYLPGRFGIRIEDIVVCGESWGESLNNSARDLVEVG